MPGLEGTTLGRYELRRLVGRGGMADVYAGYDTHFERVVAVKVFKREDEEMLERFIREARLMASLHNPYLVQVYDAGAQADAGAHLHYYIVMPFMQGGTLRARIRNSPFGLEEACRNLSNIASALDYIHRQGIVHRDIKSSNVLLDGDGRCHLSDFGIAHSDNEVTNLSETSDVLGTVEYVAPELFEENHRADARSDLYSLGVLLFEMVTGQLPFTAENQIALITMHINRRPAPASSVRRGLLPVIDDVIFKALEKKPELRYASAAGLAHAFCGAVTAAGSATAHGALEPLEARQALRLPAGTPVQMSPRPGRESAAPGSARALRTRGWIVAVLATLTLLSVIGLGVYAVTTQKTGADNQPADVPAQIGGAATASAPGLFSTPVPNATATSQALLSTTAAARTRATGTSLARAGATAGVLSTAASASTVYTDALDSASNPATRSAAWEGLDGGDGNCFLRADGYHVTEGVDLVNFHGCNETGKTFLNATLAVDVVMQSGHSGGIFFRLNTGTLNTFSGYLFEIDNLGHYKFSLLTGGLPTTLRVWNYTPALKRGYHVTNTLQVMMRDATFLLYINGTYVTQIMDGTYTTAGELGFLATTTDANADVVYRNLKVYAHA